MEPIPSFRVGSYRKRGDTILILESCFHWKCIYSPYVICENECPEQLAHSCSLIRSFVGCFKNQGIRRLIRVFICAYWLFSRVEHYIICIFNRNFLSNANVYQESKSCAMGKKKTARPCTPFRVLVACKRYRELFFFYFVVTAHFSLGVKFDVAHVKIRIASGKCTLTDIWKTKTLISLRVRASWWGPLFFFSG